MRCVNFQQSRKLQYLVKMLLQTVAHSSSIILICFMILCIKNTSLAYILDGRKCLIYEDVVTDSPEVQVEDVQTVIFNKHISGMFCTTTTCVTVL